MMEEVQMKRSNFIEKQIDSDQTKDYLAKQGIYLAFTSMNFAESYNVLYKKDPTCEIPKRAIELYYRSIHPNYIDMFYSFRKKFIANEILVEKNDNKEQRKGMSDIYDYIQNYKPKGINFDLFSTSLILSSILWKPTDEKNINESEDAIELNKINEELLNIKNIPKEIRLKRYRELTQRKKEISENRKYSKIGGFIRPDDNEVNLYGTGINIPSSRQARDFINDFASPQKKKEFLNLYKNVLLFNQNKKDINVIFDYIYYCVKTTTDLIYYQPFKDGNKRTFRSLLNIMFIEGGLPPVYIKPNERDDYKRAIFNAMKTHDYTEIYGFYLFKICDSIYELDIEPFNKEILNFESVSDSKKNNKKQ